MNELIIKNQNNTPNQTIHDMSPTLMIAKATEMATVLKDVVMRQKLAISIAGREYVKYEGWATLGSMLGFLPREKYVKELEDGSYEAMVELYNIHTGQIVGQASSICGIDEKRWKTAERYARRSMAITRATGKAYRLGFAWIMALAGYEGTPQEEMPNKALIFDKDNAAQVQKLQAYLKKKVTLSPELYSDVAETLHGKEFRQQEIEDVVTEVEISKVFPA